MLRGCDAGLTSLYWHDSEEVEIEIGMQVYRPTTRIEDLKLCVGADVDEVHFCITCPALAQPHIPLLHAMDSKTAGFKENIMQ